MTEFEARMLEAVERIAEALENGAARRKRPLTEAELAQRRAAARTRGQAPTPAASTAPTNRAAVVSGRQAGKTSTHLLIGTYCEAFKKRYGSNPVVTGKVAGLAGQVLKALPLPRAQELVQAYLQMEDRWFKTKCHDFGVFVQNLNNVTAALAQGTATPHEKQFWEKVFDKGETNGGGGVQAADRLTGGGVGSQQLLGAGGEDPVEGVPDHAW